MFAGFILVVVGVVFLLRNMGFIADIDWGIVWPAIIIAAGLSIMANRPYQREKKMWKQMWNDSLKEEDGQKNDAHHG